LHDGTKRQLLLEAIDLKKDQSYYLYGLTQEQLATVLFPLGGMQKSEVYALAKHYGVPLPSSYRESQDLCFFPEKKPTEFLKRHLKEALQGGNIVRRDGKVVGAHAGLPLYTIGQRRGLKIGGLKVPLEVVEKDVVANSLIVEEQGIEKTAKILLGDMRFVSWAPPEGEDASFECRIRSLSPKKRGTLRLKNGQGEFTFKTAIGRQSPGQSLVLYRGEEVVGGGVIEGQA
jgi:tRNA-specific 2-thiouridylase